MFKTGISASIMAVCSGIVIPDINSLTTVQYNEMIAGVVYGVIEKNNCTEIEACLLQGKDEAVLVFEAF